MVNLKQLSELARDSSSSGRKTLVEAVTDLFLAADDSEIDHIALLFGDIVLRVLGQLEEEARVALSARVSDHPHAPHDLMVRLASDSIDVAKQVLENSPVLTDEDLASIAWEGSMDHLGAIADRGPLGENVTTVIVGRGNSQVLAKVAGNEQARFTPDTFERLLEKAQQHPIVQEALIGRSDIPEEPARRLIPYLSEELRKRIKELGTNNTLIQLLAERAAQEVQAQMRDLGSAKSRAEMLIRDVKSRKRPIDDAVNQFAKADRPIDLAMLLAEVSELPAESVTRVVFNQGDTPLIILCRANGVTDNAYKNVVKMRSKRLQLSGKAMTDAINRYARMQRAEAVRALAAIKQRGGKAS
ncbi:DUF2336 domain-containing protein [Polymorphum gilvum]|uniref:DUF2336 domain-containing protein n=1 Tax=Polymorphum gilvum (strain LMG 25793 / CGMCC 1.9160 / SL003B-26A1) TaxID=991905 RepID=F2J1F5_POLGS|nr:DUF2336 domain-containing protein [Polymorphum gilvum]ADZ69737.1 hypothetical protein SL003B_1309 [Polymorphum gilvum SL003B-26A1]